MSLSNFRSLGIEKEINEEFSLLDKSFLTKLIDSEYFNYPSIRKREEAKYCTVMVADCQSAMWWYKDLIGFEFFCRIVFSKSRHNINYIKEFVGVKLTNTKCIEFRGFDPKDVIVL